jgi:hypothetical protein
MKKDISQLLNLIVTLGRAKFEAFLRKQRNTMLDSRLDKLYDSAHEFENERRFDRALAKYLEVFERSRSCASWKSVRLSFLLSSIANMDYVPARQALYEMRHSREKDMQTGVCNFDAIHEWVAINRYMRDHRTVEFFDELKQQDQDVTKVLTQIKELAIGDFVEAKRYDDFDQSDLLRMLRELQMMVCLDSPNESHLKLRRSLDKSLIRRHILGFEIAVVQGYDDIASEMVRVLVEIEPTANTFILLTQSAQRALSTNWVTEIFSRASNRLTSGEFLKFDHGIES